MSVQSALSTKYPTRPVESPFDGLVFDRVVPSRAPVAPAHCETGEMLAICFGGLSPALGDLLAMALVRWP